MTGTGPYQTIVPAAEGFIHSLYELRKHHLTDSVLSLFYFERFPTLFNVYGGVNDDEWRHELAHFIETRYLALRDETNVRVVFQCTESNSNISFGHSEGLWTALGS